MKTPMIVILVLLLSAGALVWNRERRVSEAMWKAKAEYEAGFDARRHASVQASQAGMSSDMVSKNADEMLAAAKQRRAQQEQRAQLIGYFFTPPDL